MKPTAGSRGPHHGPGDTPPRKSTPPAKTVDMLVGRTGVRNSLVGMAVRGDVNGAVPMAGAVKVPGVAAKPPQHMDAETDQHDADGGFQRPRPGLGDRPSEQDRRAGKGEQRQGVAEAPGQAVLEDIADVGAACGDTRYRRDVVGLESMLHPEQKP